MRRAWYLAGWGYVAICAMLLFRYARQDLYRGAEPPLDFPVLLGGSEAARWFEAVRPHCNALEIELQMRASPPPRGWDGAGYAAACWAVAGRIDRARSTLNELPGSERDEAAGIVFGVGHPIADAGDDQSAGPIMQLVVEFQPWNYMALYHAGMSYYAIDRPELARGNLEEFLRQYTLDDGWRANAVEILRRLDGGR